MCLPAEAQGIVIRTRLFCLFDVSAVIVVVALCLRNTAK